jgi:hypothetical protein
MNDYFSNTNFKKTILMKYLVLLLLGIVFSFSLSAQKTFDLLTVSGRYGFAQPYESVYSGQATELGSMVNLAAPIQLTEKSMWFSSLNYFYWNVENDEKMPADISNPINIHGFIIRTGLIQKLSNDQEIQLLFAPRLMSDLNNIGSGHFQFGGLAMYKKKFSNELTMAFGAMYNQELFGPYLVPLIDLDWQISERWSITGMIPIYSKIKYKVNDKFDFGIAHFGLITSYKLGAPENNGDYIERSSIDVTLYARHKISGNLYVEGRFGQALGRDYAQYAVDQKISFGLPLVSFGDNRTQKNISFGGGLIAELRLVYAVPIPGN